MTFDGGNTYNPAPGTYIVFGTITVTDGATLNITDSHFEMQDGAKFVIKEDADSKLGGTMNIGPEPCYFYSADQMNMWDGIYIMDTKSSLYSNVDNRFYDAENAIVSTNGGYFSITNGNEFDKNEISFKVNNFNGDHTGVFYGNHINCSSTPLSNPTYIIGIDIENVISSTSGFKLSIGDNNQNQIDISGLTLAIQISNSDVHFSNTEINFSDAKGIHVMGGPSSSARRELIFENLTMTSSNLNINDYGFWAIQNYDMEFMHNTFTCTLSSTGSAFKQALFSNTNGTLSIHDNDFDYIGSSSYPTHIISIENQLIDANVFSNTFDLLYGRSLNAIETNNVNFYENTANCETSLSQIFFNSSTSSSAADNTINITTGIGIGIEYCSDISIGNYNEININDYDAGNMGIKVINSGEIELTKNDVNLLGDVGIYLSYTDDYNVYDNTVTYTGNTGRIRHGISMNNCNTNVNVPPSIDAYCTFNTLNMGGYSNAQRQTIVGIFMEEVNFTDIKDNLIDQSIDGILIKNVNNGCAIGCNYFTNSYYGFDLDMAQFGEWNSSFYEIGRLNNSNDNYFQNIVNYRLVGSLDYFQHRYYYQNGQNFTPTPYNLSYNNGASFLPVLTSSGSFCNPYPPIPPSFAQGLTSNLANEREKIAGFVIDSILFGQSSAVLSQNYLYSVSPNQYRLLKSAYYYLLDNPSVVSLGLASDAKYQNFKQYMDGTNLALQYNLDKQLGNKHYKNAALILNSFNPQNLSEINTLQVYKRLIKKLNNQTYSSLDSLVLNSIAHQNTTLGGSDVYMARNLLGLYIVDSLLPIQNTYTKARTGNSGESESSLDISNQIKSYPNPANENLFVEIMGDFEDQIEYTIYSIEGRIVLKGTLQNNLQNRIQTSKLLNGVYFIELRNLSQSIYNSRFIINK
jgi:hypothetical protein